MIESSSSFSIHNPQAFCVGGTSNFGLTVFSGLVGRILAVESCGGAGKVLDVASEGPGDGVTVAVRVGVVV